MKYIKKLLLVLPLLLGSIIGLVVNFNTSYTIPSFVIDFKYFPYIWSFLYILMGISLYLIRDNPKLKKLFYIQLFFNLTWSFLFFTFNSIILAIIWLVVIIALVIKLVIDTYEYSELASMLLLPYLIWCLYALIATISILIVN